MIDYYCLPFSTIPQREALYDELHARPFQSISTPQQISHLAFKASPAELDKALALVGDLCRRYSETSRGRERSPSCRISATSPSAGSGTWSFAP